MLFPNSRRSISMPFQPILSTANRSRYRLLPRGYVIYSVGFSYGNDDGGREPPGNRKSTDTTSYDITFIVER